MKIKIGNPELELSKPERRKRAKLMARIKEEKLPKSQKARRLVQPGNREYMGKVRRVKSFRGGWRGLV